MRLSPAPVAPLALILALAACQPAPPAVPDPVPGDPGLSGADACGAEAFRPLIGPNESALLLDQPPQGTRVYRTGDALTMDFSPTRLNIEIGLDGRITAVSCG